MRRLRVEEPYGQIKFLKIIAGCDILDVPVTMVGSVLISINKEF